MQTAIISVKNVNSPPTQKVQELIDALGEGWKPIETITRMLNFMAKADERSSFKTHHIMYWITVVLVKEDEEPNPFKDGGINFYDKVRQSEVKLIQMALKETSGHQIRAARLLGMNATTLSSKMKTYKI